MKYEAFLTANPDFQSKIEAFVSILTPDPKMKVLFYMEPGKAYAQKGIADIAGASYKADSTFPVTADSLWVYFKGNTGYKSVFERAGVAERADIKIRETSDGPVWAKAFRITDFGQDIGKKIDLLGMRFVNRLPEEGKESHLSMMSLLGSTSAPSGSTFRHGYLVYKIFEFLANNEDKKFTEKQITEAVGAPNRTVVSTTIQKLAEAGFLSYDSIGKDKKGKRVRGEISYMTDKSIDAEKALQEVKKKRPWFRQPTLLKEVVGYFNENPGKEINNLKLVEELGIERDYANKVLGVLAATGYLKSRFRNRERSIVTANDYTLLAWKELLKPLGDLAKDKELNTSGIEKTIELFVNSPNFESKVRFVMNVFAKESNRHGVDGGMKQRYAVTEVIRKSEVPLQRSQIIEEINGMRDAEGIRHISKSTITTHLVALHGEGLIIRQGDGSYSPSPLLRDSKAKQEIVSGKGLVRVS